MMADKIHVFHKPESGLPLETKPRKVPTEKELLCKHQHCWLVMESRLVECKACGKLFDPFDYLLDVACTWKRSKELWEQYNEARKQYMIDLEEKRLRGLGFRSLPDTEPARSIWLEVEKLCGKTPDGLCKTRTAVDGWGATFGSSWMSLGYIREAAKKKSGF